MKFDIILADPPWFYNYRGNLDTKFRGGACQHYNLLDTWTLCMMNSYLNPALDNTITKKDSILFLWGCCPKTEDALKVMSWWGYTLKTAAFVWEKVSKKGTPVTGPGYYTGSNVEIVWLGTAGKILAPEEKLVPQVVRAPRMKHSSKPEEVQDRIDRMYPTQTKIELFARRERPGWTCIGDEISGNDIRVDMDYLIKQED